MQSYCNGLEAGDVCSEDLYKIQRHLLETLTCELDVSCDFIGEQMFRLAVIERLEQLVQSKQFMVCMDGSDYNGLVHLAYRKLLDLFNALGAFESLKTWQVMFIRYITLLLLQCPNGHKQNTKSVKKICSLLIELLETSGESDRSGSRFAIRDALHTILPMLPGGTLGSIGSLRRESDRMLLNQAINM